MLPILFTFKENCPDIRNTKVVDIVQELEHYHVNLDIYDPWADAAEIEHEYGVTNMIDEPAEGKYDAIIAAVAHTEIRQWSEQKLKSLCKDSRVIFDLKYIFDKHISDIRL